MLIRLRHWGYPASKKYKPSQDSTLSPCLRIFSPAARIDGLSAIWSVPYIRGMQHKQPFLKKRYSYLCIFHFPTNYIFTHTWAAKFCTSGHSPRFIFIQTLECPVSYNIVSVTHPTFISYNLSTTSWILNGLTKSHPLQTKCIFTLG